MRHVFIIRLISLASSGTYPDSLGLITCIDLLCFVRRNKKLVAVCR